MKNWLNRIHFQHQCCWRPFEVHFDHLAFSLTFLRTHSSKDFHTQSKGNEPKFGEEASNVSPIPNLIIRSRTKSATQTRSCWILCRFQRLICPHFTFVQMIAALATDCTRGSVKPPSPYPQTITNFHQHFHLFWQDNSKTDNHTDMCNWVAPNGNLSTFSSSSFFFFSF